MKMCVKCNEEKQINEFYKNKNEKDGLQRTCIECGKKRKKEYYATSRAKAIARQGFIKNFLKRTYGITQKDYKQMLKNQNDKCAICKKEESMKDYRSGKVRMLAVDHCHVSGQVRSLLCKRCNQVLGFVKDNIELLNTMIDYLTFHDHRISTGEILPISMIMAKQEKTVCQY